MKLTTLLKKHNIEFELFYNDITFTEYVEIYHNKNKIFQFQTDITLKQFRDVLKYLKVNYDGTQKFDKFRFWFYVTQEENHFKNFMNEFSNNIEFEFFRHNPN